MTSQVTGQMSAVKYRLLYNMSRSHETCEKHVQLKKNENEGDTLKVLSLGLLICIYSMVFILHEIHLIHHFTLKPLKVELCCESECSVGSGCVTEM